MTGAAAALSPGAQAQPAPTGSSGNQTLYSLQVLRGLAAIAVAFYHAHIIMAQPEYGGIDLFGSSAGKGWMGVNFFFVLSGFIIMYAHARDIGVPARAARYGWRRFSRVYPVYWVYLTGYILAAYVGIGHADFSWDPVNLLSAYTLLQIVPAPSLPLQPAWTLFYEVGFYLIFTVIILHRRLGQVVIGLWLIAIMVNSLMLGNTDLSPLHMWNIYFLIGGAVYLAYRRVDLRWGVALLGGGIVLLVGMLAAGIVTDRLGLANKQPLLLLALAFPFALILLGCALTERRFGWKPWAILLLLGNASYSIYLVHSPVLSVLAIINQKLLPGMLYPVVQYWLMVIISVAAGVVAHYLCEKPLLAMCAAIYRKVSGERVSPPSPKHQFP